MNYELERKVILQGHGCGKSFSYPLNVNQQLVSSVRWVESLNVELHGIPLKNKAFLIDITCLISLCDAYYPCLGRVLEEHNLK